jgi:cytochrome c peroxidase
MFGRVPTLLLVLAVLASAAASCGEEAPTGPGDAFVAALVDSFGLAPLPATPYPPYNPAQTERILLGRSLFFDPILSGESAPWVKTAAGRDPYRYRANDVACGSCHHPTLGFGDGRRLGAGVGGAGDGGAALGPDRAISGVSLVTGLEVGVEPRNSMTLLNAGLNGKGSVASVAESFQFLDGRVALGLEAQALEPLVDREEMAGDAYGREIWGDALSEEAIRDSVTLRIRAIPAYVAWFQRAFPGEISDAEDITLNHLTQAVAAYERELITPGSRYDRFVAGEYGVFSPVERRGFELFFGKALCGACHAGPMLSDYAFHVQGAGDDYDAVRPGLPGKDGAGRDLGRFHADPEDFADQKYAFRTLTVRNVEITGPYFHSGSALTLEAVVAFYDRGGRGADDVSDAELALEGVTRDPFIRPLGLNAAERAALVAFLETTTAPVAPGPGGVDLTEPPSRVPSGLLPPGIPTPPTPGPYYP